MLTIPLLRSWAHQVSMRHRRRVACSWFALRLCDSEMSPALVSSWNAWMSRPQNGAEFEWLSCIMALLPSHPHHTPPPGFNPVLDSSGPKRPGWWETLRDKIEQRFGIHFVYL
jgi:hypothetical protein